MTCLRINRSYAQVAFTAILASYIYQFPYMPAAFGADQVHDEIQVYNAQIAAVGQWTYQQHLNYAIGQTVPEVPGGFSSNHALQGTPEFAYGITEWWEAGFYLPFAVNSDSQVLSDGAKIRSLFVVPDAAKRSFFYGVNFELSYELPRFSATPWILEIRPIIGIRNAEWEFIVNPIVDVSFGSGGEADFAPAVRLARNLGEDRFIGFEYYSDFGKIGDFLPLQKQSQQLFAVTDFKVDKIDVQRRLRVHDGLRSICSQSDYWLRVSCTGQKQSGESTRVVTQNGDGVPLSLGLWPSLLALLHFCSRFSQREPHRRGSFVFAIVAEIQKPQSLYCFLTSRCLPIPTKSTSRH
jgi:hypothetical protein